MNRAFVALLLACSAPGCMFHKQEVNDISVAHRARTIDLGVTREAELPGLLGTQPTSFISMPDGGRLLVYSYGLSKTGGLNLIVVSIQKTNQALDSMFVRTSPDGVVVRTWIGDHSDEIDWDWWAFGE